MPFAIEYVAKVDRQSGDSTRPRHPDGTSVAASAQGAVLDGPGQPTSVQPGGQHPSGDWAEDTGFTPEEKNSLREQRDHSDDDAVECVRPACRIPPR